MGERIEIATDDLIPAWVYSWGGKRVHNRVQIGREVVEILESGPGWVMVRRLPQDEAA